MVVLLPIAGAPLPTLSDAFVFGEGAGGRQRIGRLERLAFAGRPVRGRVELQRLQRVEWHAAREIVGRRHL